MSEFPKIIHQIWIQGEDKIPEKFHENISKNKENNPDWKYIIWDEPMIMQLLKETNPEWLETYNKLKYLHQKADYGRYVILYLQGGIYIDMDAYTIKSLDSLNSNFGEYELLVSRVNTNFLENFLSTWQMKRIINNGVIMCKPENGIMLKLIESIVKEPICEDYDTKYMCIQRITGPKKFSNMIYDNMDEKVKILTYDYFEPCLLSECDITSNTYIVHKHESSWISSYMRKFFQSYVYLRSNPILVIILILIIICLWFAFTS